MTSMQTVKETLIPLAQLVSQLDLGQPEQAEAALNRQVGADTMAHVEKLLRKAHADGWLTPRKATPSLTFGRVSKAVDETWNQSIDVVDIAGPGAEHTHPKGEVSLCFVLEGSPKFEGHSKGWVVLPPDSHHTPTVENGRMLIVYFQPEGAVKWGPRS